ncbi:MAG: 5-formyltetrahydrofolate cyclo-ligase [Thermodesulfobacteriota bacterium]
MSSIADERRQLRRTLLKQRDLLPAGEHQRLTGALHASLLQLPAVREASNIFVFVGYRSEPDTLPLIRRWLGEGKQVSVPRTVPGSHLVAHALTDPDRELAPGYCSILEPLPERTPVVAGHLLDVVIVPGSVFDRFGGRLGYGGGYYDRFLASAAPQALRVGICFELQLVERVPVLPHDQPLDILVTERRAMITGARARPSTFPTESP